MTAEYIFSVWEVGMASRPLLLNKKTCLCSVWWDENLVTELSLQTKVGKAEASKKDLYILIIDAITHVDMLYNKWIYFMLKTQKQPEFGCRYYYEIKTEAHICICCATLFTRTLQTIHYHFKAGQLCVSLVHTWKQHEMLFFYLFNYCMYLLGCQEAESKSAAPNLILTVNLCWLSHDLHKVMGINTGCMRRYLIQATPLKNQRLSLLKPETSVFLSSFHHASAIKQPSEHLLFSIWLFDRCWTKERERERKRIWQVPLPSM